MSSSLSFIPSAAAATEIAVASVARTPEVRRITRFANRYSVIIANSGRYVCNIDDDRAPYCTKVLNTILMCPDIFPGSPDLRECESGISPGS